jgi:TetR/AcrR family transcriptional repressor of bet genes
MPKKRTDSEQSMGTIIAAAISLVKRHGASGVTVDAVATEAGCAKGLVHYHFKTKKRLWEAVAQSLAKSRSETWEAAFSAETARDAIHATWTLLTDESANGTILAWTTMFGPGTLVTDQMTSESTQRFAGTLGRAASRLIGRLGMKLRIREPEIGLLLASVVSGAGFLLLAGASREDLEGAYAAAWLGVLALARPQA